MQELKIAVLGLEILGDLRAQRMLEPLHLFGVVAEVHLAVEGMQPTKRHTTQTTRSPTELTRQAEREQKHPEHQTRADKPVPFLPLHNLRGMHSNLARSIPRY